MFFYCQLLWGIVICRQVIFLCLLMWNFFFMVNDLVVVKANSLIEASYRLSIDEVRILALTIGTMDPKSNQKVFDFTVADFVREFPEISLDNAYKQIQAAIKRIYDRSVHTEDESRVTEFRWVSSRTYFKKEGRFRIVMTDEVMPYLTQLKGQFTPYQLKNIAYFNSVHAIRIYELCMQYKMLGERKISIDDLKKWLQIENRYSAFFDFKKRVLTPAINEINEKSDLLVEVEQIKQGRSIIALKFIITPKAHSTRQIYGVFEEIKRPQVAKGSKAEGDWATENYNLAIKQLRNEGILKTRFVEDSLRDLPSEWLKVLMKYTTIINHALTREIADELNKRDRL